MHPGSSKSAARKTVRTVTLVTGITACAAAFAPMAHAQPTAKAAAPSAGKTTAHKMVSYRTEARPDATDKGCGSGTTHWFHAYDAFNAFSTCVAGPSGTNIPTTVAYSGFCGGNNKGWFLGHSLHGNPKSPQFHTFGRGNSVYHFRAPKFPNSEYYISYVYVSSWTGTDACPQPYQPKRS
jgi:hypothetical protein